MAIVRFALALLLLGFPAFAATPGTVAVAWNRNPEADVTGYKIYWGTVSRQYTQVLDVGNAVQATLTGLTNGQTYFCSVKAYNSSAQESAFSSEIPVAYVAEPAAPDPSARLVLLEAESGQLGSPMTVLGTAPEVYVDTANYSTAGWTKINFDAPMADDYHVWCRVKASTASSDSFYVTMDTGVEETFHVYVNPEPVEPRNTTWVWKKIHIPGGEPRAYSLTAGTHAIKFRVREPGTLLDRIILSTDPTFVPTDALPRSGDVLAVTGAPSSLTRLPGESAFFVVTAAATGPISYQWKKNNVAIPGATSSALVLNQLAEADEGAYKVELVRGTASASAGPAMLTVEGAAVQPVPFRVQRMTMNSDQSVSFQLNGELNSTVLIYASSDMTRWDLIGGQLNTSGTIRISDPASIGQKKRFYRLVSEAAAPAASGGTSER